MQVSVLILTYNPSKEKLFQTVNSVLWQRGISFEIILSDDGSDKNYFEDVEELFKKENFSNYHLVRSNVNTGTVKNLYRALSVANGEYIKGFGPGDLFFSEIALADWYHFMKSNNIAVSFSYPVYYRLIDKKLDIVERIANPSILDPYRLNKNGTIDMCNLQLHYLVFSDIVVGSGLMFLRTLAIEYVKKILGKVIYAEDNIFRLMILDNIPIYYFSHVSIWYEWGTGISTSGSLVWAEQIKKDWFATAVIMEKRLTEKNDDFSNRFKKLLVAERSTFNSLYLRLYKYFLFPKLLMLKFKLCFFPVKTPTDINKTDFFWKCLLIQVQNK